MPQIKSDEVEQLIIEKHILVKQDSTTEEENRRIGELNKLIQEKSLDYLKNIEFNTPKISAKHEITIRELRKIGGEKYEFYCNKQKQHKEFVSELVKIKELGRLTGEKMKGIKTNDPIDKELIKEVMRY